MKVGRRSANNRTVLDACGRSVLVGLRPSRIVSLVPSLTELVFALGAGECVVGATRFCVEPRAARGLPRVGGTKTPDVRAIRELGADLVLANVEENRREDVEALVAAGSVHRRASAYLVRSADRLGTACVAGEPYAGGDGIIE